MEDSFAPLQLFEQSGSPCLLTGADGCIIYANPALERLTCYSRGEMLGAKPRLFSSGKTPDEVYVDMWSTISSGGCWRGELLNKKKNGEQYWEYIVISPIIDEEGGGRVRYLGLLEDYTEKKRKESAQERLLDTLRNFLEIRKDKRVLPICANCHSVRHANNEWEELASFLEELFHISCSHSTCPECIKKLYPEIAQKILNSLE